MKNCVNCSAENPDIAKFCKKCGTMFISNYTDNNIIVNEKTSEFRKKLSELKYGSFITAAVWAALLLLSAFGIYYTGKFLLLPNLQEFLKQVVQLEFKIRYIFEGTSFNYVISSLKFVLIYVTYIILFIISAAFFVFSVFGIYVNLRKAKIRKNADAKKPVILLKVYSVLFKIFIVAVALLALAALITTLITVIL